MSMVLTLSLPTLALGGPGGWRVGGMVGWMGPFVSGPSSVPLPSRCGSRGADGLYEGTSSLQLLYTL